MVDDRMKKHLPFVLALIVCLIAAPAEAQQNPPNSRVALLIANSNYPDVNPPLATPATDASSVGEELKRLGFAVDIHANLGRGDTLKAIDAFISRINKGSTALFFFSGFGIQYAKQSYIIPTDAQIWTEADISKDGTSIESIVTKMNQAGANVKILIIDASRRNPYERRIRPVAAGLAALDLPHGSLAIFAAATDKIAGDAAAPSSVFITQLLEKLRPSGVSAETIFSQTRLGVARATNNEQVPWVASTMLDDFFFSSPPSLPATANADVSKPEPPKAGAAKADRPDVSKPEPPKAEAAKADRPKVDGAKPNNAIPRDNPVVPTILEDPALKELNAKLQQNPNDGAAFYSRGIIFAKNGDYSRAVSDFDQAIRLDPNDAAAFNNRCWSRAASGDLDSALRDCNEALRLRPDFADALDSRGLVLLKLNLNSLAVADYDAALKLKPQQASSLYGRGVGKRRLGKISEANSDIAAAKAINPDIADEFVAYDVR
jgi:tetratricopeptide (TPR) repeat protein